MWLPNFVHLLKVCQKVPILDFQSDIWIFLKKIHWRISFVEHIFCYCIFDTFNFQTTLFSRMTPYFWQLLLNWLKDIKNFLMDWMLVLGLEEGLAECATPCVKIWVILIRSIIKCKINFIFLKYTLLVWRKKDWQTKYILSTGS